MNEVTLMIKNKGHTLKEFLILIDRKEDWYYTHSKGGKDYEFLIMAVNGLEDKR